MYDCIPSPHANHSRSCFLVGTLDEQFEWLESFRWPLNARAKSSFRATRHNEGYLERDGSTSQSHTQAT